MGSVPICITPDYLLSGRTFSVQKSFVANDAFSALITWRREYLQLIHHQRLVLNVYLHHIRSNWKCFLVTPQ